MWSETAHGPRLCMELSSAWSETARGLRLCDELGSVKV